MRKFELAASFGADVANLKIGICDDGEDDAELGDADAGRTESVDDEPSVRNPSNFGEDEATGHRNETGVFLAVLDEEVIRSGVTDNETGDDKDGRIGNCGKNRSGRRAEEDSGDGLNDSEDFGRAGLD